MKVEAGGELGTGRSHIIRRPRLTRLLDETNARIILLIAPAGYGKTTLAREWLADRPHGWYRGSSASADVAALSLGLSRACTTIAPEAGRRMKARLEVSRAPTEEPARFADLLAQDLTDWPAQAWVCFDDYQFACDSDPAEQFVEQLLSACGVRLIVASRSRPKWATARRVLYGEIFELGRNQLAMTADEADCALRDRSTVETDGFLSLSDGWPALLGLATLSIGAQLSGVTAPEELFASFAQELYDAAAPDIQRALRRLALAPYVTLDLAETLIGADARTALDAGVELGFLVRGAGDRLEVHPLLRLFLASKFRKSQDDPTGQRIAALGELLITLEEWDDVYELASRFADEQLLVDLFEASLNEMLHQARLRTLARWISSAHSRRLDSPVIDLADAELAFRRGEFQKADVLSRQAARGFENGHACRSRASWIAGTSSHLLQEDEIALEHFKAAATAASSRQDMRQALWGQFLATEALEREPDASLLLNRVVDISGNSIDEHLRTATGQFRLAQLRGSISTVLEDQKSLIHLVDRSRDPLIRSSFLNMYAGFLVIAGQYEEGFVNVRTQITFTKYSSLDFVLPFAYLISAAANLGLRRFRSAKVDLSSCERTSIQNGLIMSNFWLLHTRLRLAVQQFDEALDILERSYPIARACHSAHAEYLAWWSVAHALAGNEGQARDLANQAESRTQRIEVASSVPWARAVLAVQNGRDAQGAADRAFSVAMHSGNIDAFVTAYRGCPKLLDVLAGDLRKLEFLRQILDRAHDYGLAQRVGLTLEARPVPEGQAGLTRREREVLDLVSQGLTNKEIGRTLYITEGTVKVHVRKICTKLGVRSRTEAAMRAAELGA